MNIKFKSIETVHGNAIVISGLFNDGEQRAIWQELEFLAYKHKMLPPDSTAGATDSQGKSRKSNRGLFLDDVYAKREISNILTINRKIFGEYVCDGVERISPSFKYIRKSSADKTLVSYYENDDFYLPHADKSAITAITYAWKTPKRFTGGEFCFVDGGDKTIVEVQSFDVLLFPGYMLHEVTKTTLIDDHPEWECNGRFAISQFILI